MFVTIFILMCCKRNSDYDIKLPFVVNENIKTSIGFLTTQCHFSLSVSSAHARVTVILDINIDSHRVLAYFDSGLQKFLPKSAKYYRSLGSHFLLNLTSRFKYIMPKSQ